MSIQPTRLKRVDTDALVNATLETDLSLDDLFDAEAVWAPVRIRLVQRLLRAGVPREERPQSLHWNWALKADDLSSIGVGALSPQRIHGIRSEGEWQGMLLGTTVGHSTRLERAGREQVYVEFIEIAPWNWSVSAIDQVGVLRGVGLQLVEMAVRWSRGEGFGGRIALHSLPQADDFYRRRCGMMDLGPDRNYRGLRYFEMTEEQTRAFLTEDKP